MSFHEWTMFPSVPLVILNKKNVVLDCKIIITALELSVALSTRGVKLHSAQKYLNIEYGINWDMLQRCDLYTLESGNKTDL